MAKGLMSEKPSPLPRTGPPQASPHEPPRRLPFFAGAAAALALLSLMVWAVWLFVEQQRLERCLASRRTDCVKIDAAPREGIRIPVR